MPKEIALISDGWDAVPADNSGLIRGSIIKFNSGVYSIGKAGNPFDDDVALVVTGVATFWLRWGEDNKPAERRITAPGQPHPDRDELPDQDESRWPLGLNGDPADPWRDSRHLFLIDPLSAQEYTFCTDTVGGRWAVGTLKGQISNMRTANPGAVPVVRLRVEKMKTAYGLKPRPSFLVVGWRQSASAPAEPLKQIKAPDGFEERRSVSTDMDDDIPFDVGGES